MRHKKRNQSKIFLVFLFFIFVFNSVPVFSLSQNVKIWTNLGIYGGTMNDIAIDPSDPNRMFAGSHMGDGLFLTEDGGNTWQPVETGFTGTASFKNHAVFAVKMAPSDPNIIWVAHNHWVEQSTDGGKTWTHISNGSMQQYCPNCGGAEDDFRYCECLVIDPNNPKTVYVGTGGPDSTYLLGAIYKTVDGGLTWRKIGFDENNDFDYRVIDIDIDPHDHQIIWAVTSSEGFGGWNGTLYRSSNGGISWEEIFSANTGFLTVAIKPNDPNIIYTGSGYGIIKHYREGGQWKYQWPIISDSGLVQDITFDPQDPNNVYATWKNPWSGDHLSKIARSSNGGKDWEIYTIEPQFLTLEIHPTNSDIIFAGEINLGVYKSKDHGQSWNHVSKGITAIVIYDVAVDPGDPTHFLAAVNCGVYEKKGNGDWACLLKEYITCVQFHPTNSQTFYVGMDGKLAKTTDSGQNWIYSAPLDDGVNDVSCIAIDHVHPDTLFISVGGRGKYGRIYKSTEQLVDGADWFGQSVLSSDQYEFNVVTIDPSDRDHIFAGGGNYFSPKVIGNLYESKEGGDSETWELSTLTDVIVNDLIIDPNDPNTIYAGCGYSGGTEIPIYKSTDGGKTWNPSYEGIPGYSIFFYSVWGSSPTDVFIVGEKGTILHYDGAWSSMVSDIEKDLYCVWGISSNDVFAVGDEGTILHYNGVWSSMNSGTTEWLGGVWGISSNDVFAVGNTGTILHYTGAWSSMNSGTTKWLKDIWGFSSTDVFAVGDEGTILHYDGTWISMESGTTEDLVGVWGSSPTDVFVVGENGTILHYDGTWTVMDSGTLESLKSVWGISSTDVFVAGWENTILRYDGEEWTKMDVGITPKNPHDIWGFSNSDIFAIGNWGSILYYNGYVWHAMKEGYMPWNAVTDLEFHPQDKNVIYAGTTTNGVFLSPNQGGIWINLGIPPYDVHAIATASLYAATNGGLMQCAGTGIIAGHVKDDITLSNINAATVYNDLGIKTLSINGEYMMITPSGICDVTAMADGYQDKTMQDVTVYGGDISWVNIAMQCASLGSNTIQAAINAANDGDIITISPGIYYENINLLDKKITLKSIDPNNPSVVAATIIDGGQKGSAVSFKNNNSSLCGFTVRNGNNSNGGGINCYYSSPLISNCVISGNISENYGGGIYGYNSRPIIHNTKILNNIAGEQPNQISFYEHSKIYSDTQIMNCSCNNTCMQTFIDISGKWGTYYKFFGKPCGLNTSVQTNELLFISFFP